MQMLLSKANDTLVSSNGTTSLNLQVVKKVFTATDVLEFTSNRSKDESKCTINHVLETSSSLVL